MRLTQTILFGAQLSVVLALPTRSSLQVRDLERSIAVLQDRDLSATLASALSQALSAINGGAGEAKAEGAKAEGAKAEGAKAEGAKAEGAKVEGAKAEGAKVEGAKAEGAKAEGAKAEGAKAGGEAVKEAKPAVGECVVPAKGEAKAEAGKAEGAAKKEGEAAKAEGGAVAEGGEATAEKEVEQAGVFGKAISIGGGDVKTDTVFTKSATGALEVELQSPNALTLDVKENKAPTGTAPSGFKLLDKTTYQIAVAQGVEGVTLQKVDYILDITNPDVIAVGDLSAARIGKLNGAGAFEVVDVGELEFEAEENEISLTVASMVGEFGIFAPVAATAAEGAAEKGAVKEGAAGEAGAKEGAAKKEAEKGAVKEGAAGEAGAKEGAAEAEPKVAKGAAKEGAKEGAAGAVAAEKEVVAEPKAEKATKVVVV